MAWYPGATRMELQPESDSQQAIRPTQFIVHSVIASWTARRIFEYWRDSTNLDSHFGLGYAGDLGQYIGTETRADANAGANRRGDGTGAVSIETASNLSGTDPWTDDQLTRLIELGAWLHTHHKIPLRLCRSASDPGYGWHSMYSHWSVNGTACPGPARIKQFKTIVFPGIVARVNGEDDDMPLSNEDIDRVARRVLTIDGVIDNPNPDTADTNEFITAETSLRNTEIVARRLDKRLAFLEASVAAIARKLGA